MKYMSAANVSHLSAIMLIGDFQLQNFFSIRNMRGNKYMIV